MKRNVVRHGIATSFGLACISLLFAATPSVSHAPHIAIFTP
jgi:hypothetical protein